MVHVRTLIASALIVAVGGHAPAGAVCEWAWETAPTFPDGERKGGAAVNQDGTIVVLGGRPWVGQGAAVDYLSPGSTAWESGPPLGDLIMHPAVGIDGLGRILVVGGYIVQDHFPFFFPRTTGSVYDLTSGEGAAIVSFQHARAFFAFATDPDHRLYVIGGLDVGREPTDFVERYDAASDLWEELAPLPVPRDHATAVYDGQGHVLVIGGAGPGAVLSDSTFAYDITTDTWLAAAPQPAALEWQSAVLGTNGQVYVVGGGSGSSQRRTIFIFDPVTGEWCNGPPLESSRAGAAVALSDDGFIYALGGYHGTLGTDTAEKLDTTPPADGDCNGNGIPDDCDIDGGCSGDCNGNGVPDECDIADGTSRDVNTNGVPDECDECLEDADCADGVACTGDACVAGSCVYEPDDMLCPDDEFYCNGPEICDAVRGCVSAGDPCGPDEICVEDFDACSALRGDVDGDGIVDLVDYAVMSGCMNGPGAEYAPGCAVFDFDADGDVDFHDCAGFQLAFTGG